MRLIIVLAALTSARRMARDACSAEARRLLEADLAEVRAEIEGLCASWPKRERVSLIAQVKARRRMAPFRTRTEELARIREEAKARSMT